MNIDVRLCQDGVLLNFPRANTTLDFHSMTRRLESGESRNESSSERYFSPAASTYWRSDL
jgi:hypothetical protein